MAWTAPMTAVANTEFTAAQFNTHVRDNILETAPAKATGAGGFIVTDGVNSVVQRTPDIAEVTGSENTTSTSYTDLATVGPALSITTGSKALIHWGAQMLNSSAGSWVIVAPQVSGATSINASDGLSYSQQQESANDDTNYGRSYLYTGLNPGVNTFTLKYRVTSGTGTFLRRWVIIVPF